MSYEIRLTVTGTDDNCELTHRPVGAQVDTPTGHLPSTNQT